MIPDKFLNRIVCMDALTFLQGLPDASVDLIATDPPYNMHKAEWDKFDSDAALVEWLGEHFQAWRRVLKPNGSVYVFTAAHLSARVEIEIGRWFNVLNNIRWAKPAFSTKAEMFDKDAMRAFFPASETILFAEQRGGDLVASGEAGYHAAYDEAKRGLKYTILAEYLAAEFKRAGVQRRDIAALFPSKTGNLTGCVSNWLLGYNLPTAEQYAAMRDYLNTHHRNGSAYLRREYDDLRREYDDLRREYDDLRRPFNATPNAPYTDVWDFATVGAYDGKHPAEKPLAMMQHIVRMSSKPGGVVLDPFCGSGPTLFAAKTLGRDFIGCDSDKHWAARARRKVAEPFAPIDATTPADLSDLPLFAAKGGDNGEA